MDCLRSEFVQAGNICSHVAVTLLLDTGKDNNHSSKDTSGYDNGAFAFAGRWGRILGLQLLDRVTAMRANQRRVGNLFATFGA